MIPKLKDLYHSSEMNVQEIEAFETVTYDIIVLVVFFVVYDMFLAVA